MAESDIEKDRFLAEHADFRFREQVCYPNGGISRFYDNGTDMVVIDEGICSHEPKEPVFPYMLITEKQNDDMHRFQRVFRFLGYARENLDSYLAKDGIVLEGGYIRNTRRSERAGRCFSAGNSFRREFFKCLWNECAEISDAGIWNL